MLGQYSTRLPPLGLAEDPDLDELLGEDVRKHFTELGAGSPDFEEKFMSEIGFFTAESPEPYGKREVYSFVNQLRTTKQDPGWVGIGMPKSFRELYNALTPSPITPLPSADHCRRNGWRPKPLDAEKLGKKLQRLVDKGWNDLSEHSDLEFPVPLDENFASEDSGSRDSIDGDFPYRPASNPSSNCRTGE
jgi:hypothetical protein